MSVDSTGGMDPIIGNLRDQEKRLQQVAAGCRADLKAADDAVRKVQKALQSLTGESKKSSTRKRRASSAELLDAVAAELGNGRSLSRDELSDKVRQRLNKLGLTDFGLVKGLREALQSPQFANANGQVSMAAATTQGSASPAPLAVDEELTKVEMTS